MTQQQLNELVIRLFNTYQKAQGTPAEEIAGGVGFALQKIFEILDGRIYTIPETLERAATWTAARTVI